IKLAGLREIGLVVKVIHRKQRGGAFTGGGGKDGRIGQHEAALIKKIPGSADDLGANAQHSGLARRAHPEMTVLHQKINSVLLAGYRKRIVFGYALDDADISDIHLISTGSALIGAYLAGHYHAGFV